MEYVDLLSSRNTFFREISPLSEFDFLTELFSFFSSFDASVSRQTSRWWNDLLSKDTLVLNQLEKNTSDITNFKKYYKYKILSIIASRNGYLELLIWNQKLFDSSLFSTFLSCTYRKLRLTSKKEIKKLTSEYFGISSYASFEGHLKVLKWLYNLGYKWNQKIGIIASKLGHLKLLKWCWKLRSNETNDFDRFERCPDIGNLSIDAACCGQIEVLEWTLSKEYHGSNAIILDETFCHLATIRENPKFVSWLEVYRATELY
jgi:hypothetical protein